MAGLVLWRVSGLPWPIGLAIILLASAGVAALTYAVQRARVRRDAAFAALCEQHGWRRSDEGAVPFLRQCLPYRRGHSIRVPLVIVGAMEGVPLRLIDGRYTTGSGKHQTHHVVSSVAIEMPFPTTLTIEAETFGHKVADALGGEDIDVESDEFSRRFWVQSPDRRTAYDILHPGAIEFLLGVGTRLTWHWNGPWLMATWTGRLEPRDCLPHLQMALEFRTRLPRHLLAAKTPTSARPDPPAPRRSRSSPSSAARRS